MDFCRNMSVSGGLPSEYPPEQVLASPCSKLGGLGGSLDDLFSGQSTEVDVSLEWLSIFVEDCFSSTGQCLPAVAPTITNVEEKTSTAVPKPLPQHNPPSLQKFVFPSKARSKRRRATAAAAKARSWAHHLNPQTQQMTTSSDPPLLQQAYWLADSELILPKKEESISQEEADTNKEGFEGEEGQQEEEMVMVMVGSKNSPAGSLEGSNGQPRRCTHCLSQRTPQWRAGPLGPKTLCNACGVRYKSGRLLPEYRPAKSPTFVSYLHSNSHKKVMEMRMSLPSSIPSEHEQ